MKQIQAKLITVQVRIFGQSGVSSTDNSGQKGPSQRTDHHFFMTSMPHSLGPRNVRESRDR